MDEITLITANPCCKSMNYVPNGERCDRCEDYWDKISTMGDEWDDGGEDDNDTE